MVFDASTSTDPDGSIVKYEWDLDGNGTYETNTGTTKTTSKTYSATGTYTVGLRVTDNERQEHDDDRPGHRQQLGREQLRRRRSAHDRHLALLPPR